RWCGGRRRRRGRGVRRFRRVSCGVSFLGSEFGGELEGGGDAVVGGGSAGGLAVAGEGDEEGALLRAGGSFRGPFRVVADPLLPGVGPAFAAGAGGSVVGDELRGGVVDVEPGVGRV